MREVARLELLELLDSFPGAKTLIWDSGLTGPMGLVAEYSVLKQHQVTIIIMYKCTHDYHQDVHTTHEHMTIIIIIMYIMYTRTHDHHHHHHATLAL